MKTIKYHGLPLPLCAIGTWGWGSGRNGGKMIFGDNPDRQTLQECYNFSVQNGLTLFDTAAVYGFGSSETILGDFAEHDKKVIVSTKFTPNVFQFASAMQNMLNASLFRLKRTSVEIYWLHNTVKLKRNIQLAIELLQSGKIQHIGLSNCHLEDIQYAQEVLIRHGTRLFGVQNHYSLVYPFSEKTGILNYCHKNDILFFPYMVLEQGVLAGKKNLPSSSRRGKVYSVKKQEAIAPLVNTLTSIGQQYNVSPVQVAVAHTIHKGMIPIIGVRKRSQAEELLTAVNLTLTNNDCQQLEKVAAAIHVEVKASWES